MYARQLTKEESSGVSNIKTYIPHQKVFNLLKLGQIIIFHNTLAKHSEASLNQNVLPRPDLRYCAHKILTILMW